MRKKNTLYRAHKYNLPLFADINREDKNLFLVGGTTNSDSLKASGNSHAVDFTSAFTFNNANPTRTTYTLDGLQKDIKDIWNPSSNRGLSIATGNLADKSALSMNYQNNKAAVDPAFNAFKLTNPLTQPTQSNTWVDSLTKSFMPTSLQLYKSLTPTLKLTNPLAQTAKTTTNIIAEKGAESLAEEGTKKLAEEGAKGVGLEGVKTASKFSKFLGANKLSAPASIGIGLAGTAAGMAAKHFLSDGFRTDAGDIVGTVGDAVGGVVSFFNPIVGAAVQAIVGGAIPGLINRGWGMKTDEQALASGKYAAAKNTDSAVNAKSLDDIASPIAAVSNPWTGGWFRNDEAAERNDKFKEDVRRSVRDVENAYENLSGDILKDAYRRSFAFGGPLSTFGSGALGIMQNDKFLDTINYRSDAIANRNKNEYGLEMPNMKTKTFDAGGQLSAAFLDDFSTDPIGAAVRYNRGMEQLQEQREAAAIEAAKEAEYADMQKRLASLETQNQGLEALMAAQSVPTALPEIPAITEAETPELPSTPSKAVRTRRSGNRNWDYIEEQLRKSGKFNDIQIEGIKYNLQRESALDPTAVGDNGAAYGLAQWHGSRKPKDMSLAGQTQHLIDTLSSFDGTSHWIGKRNYEGFMNARTPEEAHYWIARGYERPAQRIVDKVKRDSDMSLSKLRAFGGELGTNGTDFTNGLLYIDEGGSHEDNPFEGVPLGVDAEGIPNLVEEGETVYNDYVFSDRMMVPDFMYKELGLGGVIKKKGRKGMSFADASKKLAQESEQRPNDPISQAGLKASLSKLAEVQETERMKQQAEKFKGLEGYACGGKLGKKYEGLGDKSQRITIGAKMPVLNYTMPSILDLDTIAKLADLPQEKKKAVFRSSDNNYGDSEDVDTFEPVAEEVIASKAAEAEPEAAWDYGDPEVMRQAADYGLGSYQPMQEGVYDKKVVEDEYKPYATWMRYAPTIGAGIMAATDALGLTNKPDYTYADKLEAAANAAGYAPQISAEPIGNYLRYNPMDIWFQQNALNAQSRATDRALLNSNSPSRTAGLLANGYNSQIASGNLYRQALEYNNAQKQAVENFNRGTNIFNSQMKLEADMANARYRQQAKQLGLSGLAQAAALRDSIDARTGAAKSANLTNLLTSLGNIGRENFALNQINSDRSRQYGVNSDGTSTHKRSSKDKKGSRWSSGKK